MKNIRHKILSQDATGSIKGTLYQFYIALEKCFELKNKEKIYIEKYGDITISGNTQIEVKHHKAALTDAHENIWNTIKNWLDDDFDAKAYKTLVLLTTQGIGKKSLWREWNRKAIIDKLQVLETIFSQSKQNKLSPKIVGVMEHVLDKRSCKKLDSILDKFFIYNTAPSGKESYDILKQKYLKGVPLESQDDYGNSLLGFIVNPSTVVNNGWEITYDVFSARVQSLNEVYCTGTKVFPDKFTNNKLSGKEIRQHSEHLFVTKIKEIAYHEVINNAISDYVNTQRTRLEELSKRSLPKSHYETFESEILASFEPKFRMASRNANKKDVMGKSKDFYDQVIGEAAPEFANFHNTPRYYKNGTLHDLANDDNKPIKWKLEPHDNE